MGRKQLSRGGGGYKEVMKFLIDKRGMTLIEVLLVLVILSIASISIYSVFTTGLKLYQKIAIEGQLRDDADYIATMILNELYENTPNYIEPYIEDNKPVGIRMIRIDKTVDRYIVEDAENVAVKKIIYFKENNFYIKDEIKNSEIKISSETSSHTKKSIDKETVSSFINLDTANNCSQKDIKGNCQHGVIELNLVLEDAKNRHSSFFQMDPIILKSSFGF